ncbi:MAG TPA: ABC transporter substrate-binding protein [Alphaproteobacteria bacterium]|nr:ABC transporter substrate-binding protein [Alphaproteobacteria bacterium]
MKKTLSRRGFLGGAVAATAGLSVIGTFPRAGHAEEGVVKVGVITPMTGDVAGWGLPALHGAEIWAETVNARGGLTVGGDSYKVEILGWDDEFLAAKALTGAKKLVDEDGVSFIVMLGSTPVKAVQPYFNQNEMISVTTVASDLSPDSPFLLSTGESHPFYIPTSVDWMAQNDPSLKKVAILAQDDELGIPSVVTYKLAFDLNGVEVVHENLFPIETLDFAPIISAALAAKPDLLCFDTSYPDFMNLMIEEAYLQGFRGKMISVTLDNYDRLIEKTSKEFLEGFVFLFPDFDDSRMAESDINFEDAAGYYRLYNERHPGTWSAQSWTYSAMLQVWKAGVEAAQSINPPDVLAALKGMNPAPHIFGPAKWWGKDVFGIDNVLIGHWPVVQMQNGKAKFVAMGDVAGWLDKNQDELIKRLKDVGSV